MTKSELRKIYLERRRSLSAAEIADKSLRIAELFFDNFDPEQIKLLHCFIAIEKFNEIDTTTIFHRLWSEFPQITTVVPRVDHVSGEIGNFTFGPETQLVKNQWGIREPVDGESVSDADIDLVLVPLLCFDRGGHRVGYGKGFYDKLLSKCRPDCVKIGLSYFPPEAMIEDTNPYDVKLDRCITPDEIYNRDAEVAIK